MIGFDACVLFMRFVPFAALGLMCAKPALTAGLPSKPLRLGLCASCHGETGMARGPGIPHLAGQPLDYLRKAMKDYRDGTRNVPLMRHILGPLNESDIDQLARWYSAQTHPSRSAASP